MKPLEIVFYKSDGSNWLMKLFYDDGTTEEIIIGEKPSGVELNKHYSISDIYGYKVVDDRKGL